MVVETVKDCEVWLRAWGGRPRRGVLAGVLRAERMRLGIMRSNPAYGEKRLAESEALLAFLEKVQAELYPGGE